MPDNLAKLRPVAERPSAIVCIAYRQLSIMSGTDDPTNPCCCNRSAAASDTAESTCIQRLLKLPLVASTASVFSNSYSNVKQSHHMVTSIFSNVEEGLAKGAEVISPVTTKIGVTLEGPLKAMDGAICVGLDFLEEKIPSLKLPPDEIYDNTSDYIRDVFDPVLGYGGTIFESAKLKYEEVFKSETCDEEGERDGRKKNERVD